LAFASSTSASSRKLKTLPRRNPMISTFISQWTYCKIIHNGFHRSDRFLCDLAQPRSELAIGWRGSPESPPHLKSFGTFLITLGIVIHPFGGSILVSIIVNGIYYINYE
jgi:hypothetical protein